MGLLYGFLVIVEMLVCAMLIIVIFMQKSKGGMGGSAFGGGAGEAIFGSRMGNVLTKATVVLGVIFLLNTLVLTVMTARRGAGGSIMETAPQRPVSQPSAMPPAGDAADWMGSEMPAGETFDMPVVTDDAAAGDADVLTVDPVTVPETAVAPVVSDDPATDEVP